MQMVLECVVGKKSGQASVAAKLLTHGVIWVNVTNLLSLDVLLTKMGLITLLQIRRRIKYKTPIV